MAQKLNPFQAMLVIRKVLNNNFTFADLSPRFKGVDSSTGNIFCPFHENHSSPAAKMYWDDVNDMWVLHCFGECHKNYTAYDYVALILCEKYNKYKSPLEFLKANMNHSDLFIKLEAAANNISELESSQWQAKEDYINKVAEDNERTEDYIEALYTA